MQEAHGRILIFRVTSKARLAIFGIEITRLDSSLTRQLIPDPLLTPPKNNPREEA